ncbi:restriction endonuclease [Sediminibacillus terrae]
MKAVREILGATKYYSAVAAWVVSIHKFTEQAKELAYNSNV